MATPILEELFDGRTNWTGITRECNDLATTLGRFTIQNTVVGIGTDAVKIFNTGGVAQCADTKHRAEMDFGNILTVYEGHESWFGFMIQVEGFPPDRPGYICFQTKTVLDINWGAALEMNVMPGGFLDYEDEMGNAIFSEPIDAGVWYSIVLRHVHSLTGNGIDQAWLKRATADYVQVGNNSNKINATTQPGRRVRLGSYYGGDLTQPDYTMYLDSIRVAEGSLGFADVDPWQAASPTIVTCVNDSTTIANNATVTDYAVLANDTNAAAITAISAQTNGTFTFTATGISMTSHTLGSAGGVASCQYTARNTDNTSSSSATFSVQVGAAVSPPSTGILFQDAFTSTTPDTGTWETTGGTVAGGVCSFTAVGQLRIAQGAEGVDAKTVSVIGVTATGATGNSLMELWGLRNGAGNGYYLSIQIGTSGLSGVQIRKYLNGVDTTLVGTKTGVVTVSTSKISLQVTPGESSVGLQLIVDDVVDSRYDYTDSTSPVLTGSRFALGCKGLNATSISADRIKVTAEVVGVSLPTAYNAVIADALFSSIAKNATSASLNVIAGNSGSLTCTDPNTGLTLSNAWIDVEDDLYGASVAIVDGDSLTVTGGTRAQADLKVWFQSTDSLANTCTGSFEIAVTNATPTASSTTISVPHNTASFVQSVSFDCTDADTTDFLTVSKVTNPTGVPGAFPGTVTFQTAGSGSAGVSVTGIPALESPFTAVPYTGTYKVTDSDGVDSTAANYVIQVNAVHAPDASFNAVEETELLFDIFDDLGWLGSNVAITSIANSAEGVAVGHVDSVVSYTPPAAFVDDTDTFVISWTDDNTPAVTGTTTISVHVAAAEVDPAPNSVVVTANSIITSLSYAVTELTDSLVTMFGISASQGGTLIYTVTQQPRNSLGNLEGRVTADEDGLFTWAFSGENSTRIVYWIVEVSIDGVETVESLRVSAIIIGTSDSGGNRRMSGAIGRILGRILGKSVF